MVSQNEGKKLNWVRYINPKFSDWSNCPTLPTTGNSRNWICNNEKCIAPCNPNHAPMPNSSDGNSNPRLRCKNANAKKGEPNPYWNKDPAVCQTCPVDMNSSTITDSNVDIQCNIGNKNMKSCYLSPQTPTYNQMLLRQAKPKFRLQLDAQD